MLWISAILFLVILTVLLSVYFLVAPGWTERKEIKKRLSLLELRNLQLQDLPDVLKNELLSDVPALNRILANLNVAVQIDKRLKQANMEMKVSTFILLSCLLFGLALLVGALLHWPFLVAVLFGAFLFAVPTIVVTPGKNRRMKNSSCISRPSRCSRSFGQGVRSDHQLVGQEMPDPIGRNSRRSSTNKTSIRSGMP
jgi:Flp pilus assembly protein TadB